MGNCIFKKVGEVEEMVKVVTPTGGLMELYAPITAECITNEFPGHGIFLSPHSVSPPLLHHEKLSAGQYYYLLPLHSRKTAGRKNGNATEGKSYRMSVDNQRRLKRLSESEAGILPRYSSAGVWKVRLVIDTEQLSQILSQEVHTEALIESVRTVAKCGAGVPGAANSDQQSWITGTGNSATDSIFSSSTSR